MGSWGPGALEEYQKDCIARGGTIVPDPMMVSRCVVKPIIPRSIPPGEKQPQGTEPVQNPQVIQPRSTTPVPHRSDTTIILIIVIVLLVLLLSAGAAYMLMR
jgi:hypothetical protein